MVRDFSTPGEKCTQNAIWKHKKPQLDIKITQTPPWNWHTRFLDWLDVNNIVTLNIAGNSEKSARGIGALVEEFLVRALRKDGGGRLPGMGV